MQRFKTYISIGAAIVVAALASCNKADDIGGTLPDGTTPIAFTATLHNLDVTTGEVDTRAATRATAPVGATIAISSDGGTTNKTHTVDAGGSTLTPTSDPLYWTKQKETLAAWTPATIVSGTPANTSQYNIATQTAYTDGGNSGNNGSFENVLHAPSKDYTFSKTSPAALTLRHAFAKVNITLTKGDGVSDDEITNATVKLSGYTSGTMGYGGLIGSGANDGIEPTKTINGGTTFSAYLIPQQMEGKRFIRVTAGSGAAAREYYYTPTGQNDANLEAGKQYTYNVTVKKDKLEVTTVSGAWADGGSAENAGAEVDTYSFTLPSSAGNVTDISVCVDGSTSPTTGNVYSIPTTATKVEIKYKGGEETKSFVIQKGLCQMAWSYDEANSQTTCTYTGILTDVVLAYDDYAQVGDYYYSDGTWSRSDSKAVGTVIGRVFYVGTGEADDISYYNDKGMTKIHGYVIALTDLPVYPNNGGSYKKTSFGGLKDAGSTSGIADFDVPEIPSVGSATPTGFNGYQYFKIIRDNYLTKTDTYLFPIFADCTQYTPEAPKGTSGWYIPTLAQLLANPGKLGGVNGDYLSCNEKDSRSVYGCYYDSYRGAEVIDRTKNDYNTLARAVLTF